MNKKTKIILGSLALVMALVAVVYFVRLPYLAVSPEDAVPRQTALVLPLSKAILAEAADKKNFSNIFLPDAVAGELAVFEKNFGKKIPIKKDELFWAAIQPTRSSGIDVLFIVPGQRSLRLSEILRQTPGGRVRSSFFKDHEVFTVQAENEKFAFSQYRNLLLWARHPYLVENAISQLKSPATSLCRNEGFSKIARRAKPAPGHLDVLLNLETFSGQFAPLVRSARSENLQKLANYGSWVHLQLPVKNPAAGWEATLFPATGHPIVQTCRRGPKLAFKNAFRALPDNLGAFVWLSVHDFNPKNNTAEWDRYFEKWVGNEVAFAIGEPMDNDQIERFVLVKTADPKKAEASLEAFSKTTGAEGPADFQMFKILQLRGPATGELLGMGNSLPDPVACVLGEYVLFSNSQPGIERWLGKYIAGQTLSKNVPFLQSIRTLPTEANGFLYFESGQAWQQLSPFFLDEQLSALGGNPLRFSHLAATLTWKSGLGEMAVVTPGNTAQQQERPANILWQTPLGSPAAMPPAVFKNPRNGEMEIFIQDERHRIFLLSRSGRILWWRQLDEPLKSKVFQIDLNNSGDGQLAFSTASGLYIIDRQGDNVPGFPLKLQIPASNGVTVIDFFQSHEYRFFIACENGNAYGFDEKGSPVEGWRPKTGVGIVRHPLVHFQAQNMDFLILLDETGRLQVFQKNGQDRFPEQKFETRFPQPPDFQASSDSYRIVACDAGGKVYVSNLQGSTFKLSLDVGKKDSVLFAFADITGDSRKDYIALSGYTLAAYFYEGKNFNKAFTYQFQHPQDVLFPVSWTSTRKTLVGTVCKEKMQISLLSGNGKMLPQFPLAGTTEFTVVDLLDDGKPVVVTANGDRMVAYSIE